METLTKEAVAGGFKAAGERMDDIETNLQKAVLCVEDLVQRTKLLRARGTFDHSPGVEGKRMFWPTEEAAKQFGEIILNAMRGKAISGGDLASGGVLVPDDLFNWMIQKMGQYGKFRKNATVVTLGAGGESMVPKVETDLVVYCVSEGGTITESDMEFSQVKLNPKIWACFTKVSNALVEDAIVAIGEIIGISMARSLAKKEDQIGFLGDGTDTYFGMRGIVGALRAVDDTIANIKGLIVGSGNAYSELTLGDFRKVCARLPEDAEEGALWFVSKKFFWNVMLPLVWAESAGAPTIGMPEYYQDGPNKYYLGYKVEFVSAMPSVEANSQICAILGDLQIGAYLGERKSLEIAHSSEVLFQNFQTAIRGVERIDINAYSVGDTTDAGAIVGLITADS